LRPSCSVAVGDHFVQRWGNCWNADAILQVQQQIRTARYQRLVQSAGRLWRPLLTRRLLYRLTTNPAALAAQFWFAALLRDGDVFARTPDPGRPSTSTDAAGVGQTSPSAA
jgi:hypothetical protein